jgi:hypothetical protein
MEKKVAHRLPIPFTYTALIEHYDMPLPKIIHGKNLLYRPPSKKGRPQKNLSLPNTLLRETEAIITT